MTTKLPVIYCKDHNDETLTNFCCLQSCLQGLCPECIDEHYKFHQRYGVVAEIDTLKTVVTMCERHIKIGIDGISEQISRLEATRIRDADELIEEGVREIGSVKEAFHNSIDNYFDGVSWG